MRGVSLTTSQYQMALQAYAEGRYEDAMQRFSDLLYEDPRNPRLHIWLGASFRKAGKLEYAKVQYQQVLTLTTDADLVSLARSSLAQIQQQSILANPRRHDDEDPMATTLQPQTTGYKVLRKPAEVYGVNGDGQNNGHQEEVSRGMHQPKQGTEPNAMGGGIPMFGGKGAAKNTNNRKSSPNQTNQEVADTTEGGKIPPPPGLAPSSGAIPPLPPLAVRVKPSSPSGNNASAQGMENLPAGGTSVLTADHAVNVASNVASNIAPNGKLNGRSNGKNDVQSNDGLDPSLTNHSEANNHQETTSQEEQTLVAESTNHHGLVSAVAKRWGRFGKGGGTSTQKPQDRAGTELSNQPDGGILMPKQAKGRKLDNGNSGDEKSRNGAENKAVHPANGSKGGSTGVSLAELISRTQAKDEQNQGQSGPKGRLALEDVVNFANLKSKATLWAIALATLPVVGMGVMTYQMGDRLAKQQTRQIYLQNLRNISTQVQQFWQEQMDQTKITAQLLTGENPNHGASSTKASSTRRNLSAAVVTNRLRLYHQANPKFDDLFVVQSDGEILGRADTKPSSVTKGTVLMLEPGVLEQISQSRRPTMVMIPKTPMAAIVVPMGFNVTVENAKANENKPSESKSAEKGTLVVATIPLDAMQERLNNVEPMGVYLADSQGRTLSSRPIKGFAPLAFGSAVSNSFPLAGILQGSTAVPETKFQDDVSLSDRNQGYMAYTPLFLQAGGGNGTDLQWGVFLVGEKDARSNSVLILAILVAIGATPVLVGLIAFVLSHQVSSRINHIRYRVMSVARNGLEDLMRKQTLLIDEAELLTRDASSPRDELGHLSKSINDMVEQFQTMLRKQHRQKQQLQNQVVKLVYELSQLADVETQTTLPQDSDIEKLMESLKAKLNNQQAKEKEYLEEKQVLQQQLNNLAQELADMQPAQLGNTLVVNENTWHELPEFMNSALVQLKTVVNQVKQGATQMNQSLGHNELTLTQLVALVAQQSELAQHTANSAHTLRQGDLNIIRNGQLVINISHQIHTETLQNDQTITDLISTWQNMHQSMVQTAHVVQNLGNSSQKVNRVLALLNELAVQINFIAINASLEGAKSGHHNSSLMMIADEIGQMAHRSVSIAKEVESIMEHLQVETTEVIQAVESSRDQMETGNNLLQNTRTSLQELSGLSQNIYELVTAMTETTQFQSKTSESVANLLNNMNQIAHNTLKASEEAKYSLQSTMQVNERLQNIFTPNVVSLDVKSSDVSE